MLGFLFPLALVLVLTCLISHALAKQQSTLIKFKTVRAGEAGIVAPCVLTEHKLCFYNRTRYLLYCSSSLKNLHPSDNEEGKKKPRLSEVVLTCMDRNCEGTHLGFCSSCVRSRGLDKAFSLGVDERLGTAVLLSPLY